MDYQIAIEATHEPITLAEAKMHLRIDTTDEDTYIRGLIATARQWCETYQRRSWLRRTITLKRDDFADEMVLPLPPLVLVSAINYIDAGGTLQTLGASVYSVDTTSEPGRVRLAYGQTWPTLRGDAQGVTITYVAGCVATFTASADTDTITVNPGDYRVGDCVQLYTTGTLPAGLAANTDYYITSIASRALKLATSLGGATVNITGAGTGTHTIDAVPQQYRNALLAKLTQLYFHRGDSGPPDNSILRDLLGPDRQIGT